LPGPGPAKTSHQLRTGLNGWDLISAGEAVSESRYLITTELYFTYALGDGPY